MRLAFANVLALIAYVCVIWTCFAFIYGSATNSAAPWGFTVKLNIATYGFAMIYMILAAPIAFLLMLMYFMLFRAQFLAIAALAVVAGLLSIAFMSPLLRLPGWPGGSTGGVNVRLWIIIIWSGITAALAHHIVFALVRPRRLLESLQS